MQKLLRYLSLILFFGCSAVLMLMIFGYSRIPDEISMQEFSTMSESGTYVCRALRETAVSKGISDKSRRVQQAAFAVSGGLKTEYRTEGV